MPEFVFVYGCRLVETRGAAASPHADFRRAGGAELSGQVPELCVRTDPYIKVMRPLPKPRPVLASFLAAGTALLPVLLMALSEIFAVPTGMAAGEPDDAGYRGAGLVIVAMPFLYIVAVPVCYAVGALLPSLGLYRFVSFLAGAAGVALLLGLTVGALLSAPARFGATDLAISVAVTTLLFLVTVLPAASCWWFFAVRPHNTSLNTDAPPGGRAPVS